MLTDLFGILNTPAFWLAGKPVPWSDLIGNIFALLTAVYIELSLHADEH